MRSRELMGSSLSVLATLSPIWCVTNLAAVSALPLRSARAASTGTSGEDAQAITDELGRNIDIVYPDSSSKMSRRNLVVENFFADKTAAHSAQLKEEIKGQAKNLTAFLQSTRRTLHQRPELMYQEKETSGIVQNVLSKLNIKYTTGWSVNTHPDRIKGPGGYGVVADIGTGEEPCVLLRADMDALPIYERTEGVDEFKSQNDDRMHA